MNRVAAIIGILLLIVALVFLNRGISKTAPADHDHDEQAASQTSKKPAAAPANAPGSVADVVPPEITVNDPAKAKTRVDIGWVYDPETLPDPAALASQLQQVQEYVGPSNGAMSLEVVNLDVPAEDLSPAAQAVTQLGITVNGKLVLSGNPPAGKIISALQAGMHSP